MKRLRTVLLFVLCWVAAYLLVQTSRWWHLPPPENPPVPVPYAEKLAQQRQRFGPREDGPTFDLQEHRGRVLVVCAGGVGKEETERWLRQLARLWAEDFPQGVAVVWLGVGAPPQEVSDLARRLQLPFPAYADPTASAAELLNHRLDPTLYVVGKWSTVRYAGELQPTQLTRMLVMLSKEREDGDRQFFTSRGADVGHLAPDFSLPDPEGRTVSLKSLRGRAPVVCLLFAGADLHSGVTAIGWMEARVSSVGADRLQTCIIYSLVSPAAVRRTLRSARARPPLAGLHVLIDESGEVARMYRLRQPPLSLVICPRGIVRHRGISGHAAAAAISSLLRYGRRPGPTQGPLLPP